MSISVVSSSLRLKSFGYNTTLGKLASEHRTRLQTESRQIIVSYQTTYNFKIYVQSQNLRNVISTVSTNTTSKFFCGLRLDKSSRVQNQQNCNSLTQGFNGRIELQCESFHHKQALLGDQSTLTLQFDNGVKSAVWQSVFRENQLSKVNQKRLCNVWRFEQVP